MNQNTSYYLYQKYEQRGEQNPIPVYPNVWSVDGDGTMPLVIKQENDPNCGYIPPSEPIYRWTNIDINEDYWCDECSGATEYRIVSTAYTCVGFDKYYLNEEQVSYDSGATWITISTTIGDLVQRNSLYCGYIPPSGGTKFIATYSDSQEYSVECNSSTTLTTGETKPSGYNPSAMTDAIIGNCVLTIDRNAFTQCRTLSSVTFVQGSQLDTIGSNAFSYCNSLSSITIPDSVISIGVQAFNSCSGLTSISIPSGVTSISDYAFGNCSGITNCTFEENSLLTSIGSFAFYSCTGLTSINIPNGVTSIETSTFGWCTSLSSVSIPSGVTSIGGGAFGYCYSLTSINIPDSVISIGRSAFGSCYGLTSINIPSGVTEIGEYAFRNCSNLTSITVNATTPPTLGYEAFSYTNNCPIYVPAASVNAYKAASGWSSYASRIQAITN